MELYFKEMPKSILLVLKCTLEPANVDSENMDTYIIHALSEDHENCKVRMT